MGWKVLIAWLTRIYVCPPTSLFLLCFVCSLLLLWPSLYVDVKPHLCSFDLFVFCLARVSDCCRLSVESSVSWRGRGHIGLDVSGV